MATQKLPLLYHKLCMRMTEILYKKKNIFELLQEFFEQIQDFMPLTEAQLWNFKPQQELFFSLSKKNASAQDWHMSQELWQKTDRILFLDEKILQNRYNTTLLPAISIPLKEKSMLLILAQKELTYKKKDLYFFEFLAKVLSTLIEKKQDEFVNEQKLAYTQAFFDSASYLMWSVTRDLQIIRYNKAFFEKYYKLFSQQPHNLPSFKDILRSFSKKEQQNWLQYYQNAFEGTTQNFEMPIRWEGIKIWGEITLNPVIFKGNIIEVSGIVQDISSKKEALESLKNSESRLRNIFASFQDVYLQINREGVIVMITPSVEQLTGRPYTYYLNKNIWEFVKKNDIMPFFYKLVKKNELRNQESEIWDIFGNKKIVISNFRIINDDRGQPLLVEGITRDITELRETYAQLREAKEFAEKSLQVKQQFLSNISHEIRTPMNGIIGMIDILLDAKLNTEQEQYAKTIKSSSELLLNILNDVLDLSKIEAGKMILRKETIEIRKIIERLKNTFAPVATSKDIKIFCQIEDSVPQFIEADETRLLQILSNLTSNAIKFTDKGKIQILLYLIQDQHYKVEVIDTGIGISDDDQKLLFESFKQLDHSYTKKYSGTGLGLSISKAFVQLMEGEIGVESTLGKGSTFWFTFRAATAEKPLENQDKEHNLSFFMEKSPFILLVDDNLVNLQVAQTILKKANCEVITAQSALAAIELFKEYDFDIILMDIQMPVMDGITAMKKIRQLGKKTPPIIAMTAYTLASEQAFFIEEGMDECLNKPIRAEILLDTVAKWTNTKKSATQNIYKTEISNTIIDHEIVQQLKKYGGTDMLNSIYKDFELETLTLFEGINQAITQNNYTEIRQYIHTLKGTAGTLGITKIAKLATEIDTKLKKSEFLTLEKDLQNLNSFFTEYQEKYVDIIKII